MIIFAILGVIVNFLAAYFTKEGDSLNQKAVNLHMLEDVFGWVVVLIGAILDAGGLAIGAHMFLYSRNSLKDVKHLMDYIVSTTEISGFEAYHSSHTEKQRKFIIDYANQNNLLYTGGTDFHSGPQTILGYGQEICPVAIDKSCVNFFKINE